MPSTAECLLLYDCQPRIASTVGDHIEALAAMPEARVWGLPILGDLPPKLDLDRFDWIIVHYSLCASHGFYLSESARSRLANATAIKAIFVQDEYRHVFRTQAAMVAMDARLVFTCCPKPEMVYGGLAGVRFETVLTGYVPDRLRKRNWPHVMGRPIDIGYRARELPYSLGRLGQEKRWIAEMVEPVARDWGYVTDISTREQDRIYGPAWETWMQSCKTVLGTESGASVFDFDGSIAAACNGLERFTDAEPFLADAEDRIPLAQISPRCFEAAALGTPMILYEGEYSGILKPWRHYIPLRKDHGNMGTVMDAVRSRHTLDSIAIFAWCEVADTERWSFRAHAKRVAEVLGEMRAARGVNGYERREFLAATRPSLATRRKWALRRVLVTPVAGFLRAAHHTLPGRDLRRRLIGYH